MGKSRLLDEVTAGLRAAGPVVLAGRCLDIGDASPLHPLLQALRRFEAGATDARTRAAVRNLLTMVADETPGREGRAPCWNGSPGGCT